MNTLLIILDPTVQNNEILINYIKNSGSWARIQPNVWMVKSNDNAIAFRDNIIRIINSSQITVINVTGDGWGTTFSNEVTNWMKDNL